MTAAVTLPPGVTYLAGGTLGMAAMAASPEPGGWSCSAAPAGSPSPGTQSQVQCSHGPLAPGASATTYLRVAIAPDAPLGAPPSVAVGTGAPGGSGGAGGARVTARAAVGVAAAGLSARYAAMGHEAVATTGNAFPHCGWWQDVIPGWGQQSSSARLAVPGQVEWAGLYWSWAGDGPQAGIQLAGPGGGLTGISAADTGTDTSLGVPVHQSFANVTAMVRQDGAGVWTAGIPGGDPGDIRYSGWALVVVVASPAAPAGQVMILDGTHVVAPGGGGYSIPLEGLLSSEAGVQETRWAGPEGGPEFSSYREPVRRLRPGHVRARRGPVPGRGDRRHRSALGGHDGRPGAVARRAGHPGKAAPDPGIGRDRVPGRVARPGQPPGPSHAGARPGDGRPGGKAARARPALRRRRNRGARRPGRRRRPRRSSASSDSAEDRRVAPPVPGVAGPSGQSPSLRALPATVVRGGAVTSGRHPVALVTVADQVTVAGAGAAAIGPIRPEQPGIRGKAYAGSRLHYAKTGAGDCRRPLTVAA